MKKILKTFLFILFFTFNTFLFSDNKKITIPVLCYHHISTDNNSAFSNSVYAVTKEQFEMQMKYLFDNGYKTISLDMLYDFLNGKNVNLPPKPIIITFDDGFKSHLNIALPLLKKYNFEGVFFIYPSVIISKNKSIRKWHLTKEELIKLHKAGGDIQSHSYYHPLMHRESENINKNQFISSKKWLEETLNKKINYFAYPFGSYTKNVMKLGKKYGYKCLFTINNGPVYRNTNPLSINRIMITRAHSLKQFSNFITSLPLEIKYSSIEDGSIVSKLDKINIILNEKISLKDYNLNIQLNGANYKNIIYNENNNQIEIKIKNLFNGINQIQIIFNHKKKQKPSFINTFSFIYNKNLITMNKLKPKSV